MFKDSEYFNIFGEFKDKSNEESFLNSSWQQNKNVYFLSYNLCCILLFFAGIFIDFKRTYTWGSATSLTLLRALLVIGGLSFYLTFKNKKVYSRYIDYFGLALMILSSLIIVLLNLMTGGMSKTMIPGSLIITASYYVVLPTLFSHALIPSIMQFLSIALFYKSTQMGFGSHLYVIFLMFSINTVLIFYKKMQNTSNRRGYLIAKYHEEASIAKDTILGIIGHDLKNPLTIILSRNHFLKKAIEQNDSQKALAQLEPINNATNRIADMLQSLLTWALANNTAISKKPHCILKVSKKAIEYCEHQAKEKSINICDNVTPYIFKFDSNMMETIIRNILANAVKFTPLNKEITLHGEILEQGYKLEIRDQGIGMHQDMIDDILQGTNEKSEHGTEGETGTGLGLRIVSDFIKHHNARLDIESTKDQGTSFIITFNT